MTRPLGTLTKNTERQPVPGEIERDEKPAEQEARGARKPEHNAVDGKGAVALTVGEQQMQRRQHLRHHQRGGGALRQPRDDQLRA